MNFLKNAKDFIVKKWEKSNKKEIAFTLFVLPMFTVMFLNTSVMSFWQAFIVSCAFLIMAKISAVFILNLFNKQVDEERLQKYDTAQADAIGVHKGSHMQKFLTANVNKNVSVGSLAANKFIKQMKSEQVKNYKNIDEDTKKALHELFNKENSFFVQEEIPSKDNIEEFSKLFHGKK